MYSQACCTGKTLRARGCQGVCGSSKAGFMGSPETLESFKHVVPSSEAFFLPHAALRDPFKLLPFQGGAPS